MPTPSSEIAPADLAACRAMLASGSRSFRAASLLLPARVARPAAALYAFCRVADDLIDRDGGGMRAVRVLERRLDAICAGRPGPWPADRALAAVVARHGIPRALPAALLEGLAWDAQGRNYVTLADLEDYAARVAGSIGAMMALLMGAASPVAVARAADLGVAMQLTNIARDVGEDARAGRLYLPSDWLLDAGIAPEAWLAAPRFTPALAVVVARLLRAADAHYRRAEAGIPLLPADCRPGIAAARLIYAEIGRVLERQGHDSVSARAVVGGRRKVALLAGAPLLAWRATSAPQPAAPLAANRFLVDAAAAAQRPRPAVPWWAFGDRVVWAAELFSRLDERERRRVPASDRA
ncbi:phytoene/squalene synthase family protein [Humitalea sp. 24SJ18S-53]|uniref:phytoene/squalene synthase family protein n=1 Tax=Humitalea sp. 24SJ18S-53 TaxID=3422307 RepID=UPI003D67AF0C